MSHPKEQTAVVISQPGGPEVLLPAQVRVPEPGPGQLLIRVVAAGVNRHDCLQRAAGVHHDGSPVPGLEAAGEVVAIGAGVTDVAPGDRVMVLLQGGGYAQYALAEAAVTMPIPEGMEMVEAAALPEALFTAWWNFFFLMTLRPEDFALIHGGTSGVGHLALQALSALGYRVLATAGSAAKVEAARGFGAMAAFNYRDEGLAEAVLEATGGQGIGALLDVSAGAHLAQDLAMMAPDGCIAHLSAGGGAALSVPLRPLMAKRIRITGSFLRPLEASRKAEVALRLRREVWPLLGAKVRATIAASYPLEQACEAHRDMEKGSHIGKFVLFT
ncbi:NAD(P)H-quinone oxidoreductase [Oceanicola sp. S124]|uniref:NAD(P)H-quinone oxidoreductase n=1 Tax=Oceanicola sp. S124 TaxID=1042378 RepID=UPI0002D7D089|nr:NAD(P)H-quinone oxidoreductase [Oceanicola sp. S124]